MTANDCSKTIMEIEAQREKFVKAFIQWCVNLTRKGVDLRKYVNSFEAKDMACRDKAIEYFDLKENDVRYFVVFDEWVALNTSFAAYFRATVAELKKRYPHKIDDSIFTSRFEAFLNFNNVKWN